MQTPAMSYGTVSLIFQIERRINNLFLSTKGPGMEERGHDDGGDHHPNHDQDYSSSANEVEASLQIIGCRGAGLELHVSKNQDNDRYNCCYMDEQVRCPTEDEGAVMFDGAESSRNCQSRADYALREADNLRFVSNA